MLKLIAIILFLPLTIFSQVDLKNISLTNPDLAILYIGIHNEIELTGLEYDSTYIVKYTKGFARINDWGNGKFHVIPRIKTKDTLYLYRNDNLIFTKIFELKRLPDPIAQLGDITDTIATIKEILSNPNLNIILPNCYYKMSFRIVKFRALLIQNSGDTLNEYKSNWSCTLPRPLVFDIMYSNAGDRIVLYYITVRSADSCDRTLNQIRITIKED